MSVICFRILNVPKSGKSPPSGKNISLKYLKLLKDHFKTILFFVQLKHLKSTSTFGRNMTIQILNTNQVHKTTNCHSIVILFQMYQRPKIQTPYNLTLLNLKSLFVHPSCKISINKVVTPARLHDPCYPAPIVQVFDSVRLFSAVLDLYC